MILRSYTRENADWVLDDYRAVREELRLYNPEYCLRPHVVALNKVDMLGPEKVAEGCKAIKQCAEQLQVNTTLLSGCMGRCLSMLVLHKSMPSVSYRHRKRAGAAPRSARPFCLR